MRAVGIKALKDKLSEYVRLAGNGETILVTDRDRVVAEIGPPRITRADSVSDAVIAEGVRQGWITPRRTPRGPLPEGLIPPRRPDTPSVQSMLEETREDRWPVTPPK